MDIEVRTGNISHSSLRRAVHKEEFSLVHRFRSIHRDCNYVHRVYQHVCKVNGRQYVPVFANLRCGAWYVTTQSTPCAAVHFKSTDGHVGSWNFSTTRLNLHLVEAAVNNRAAIVVDSTRMGKTFPDSLSRCIPVWACVIACVVLGTSPAAALRLPPWVPDSEKALLIDTVIPGLLSTLPSYTRALLLELLSGVLTAPLEICWLAPHILDPACVVCGGSGPLHDDSRSCFLKAFMNGKAPATTEEGAAPAASTTPGKPSPPPATLVCVSASFACEGIETTAASHGWRYIQGAGDDAENWSEGYTPDHLWAAIQRVVDGGMCPEDASNSEFFDLVTASLSKDAAPESMCSVTSASAIPGYNISFQPPVLGSSGLVVFLKPMSTGMSSAVGRYYDTHTSLQGMSEWVDGKVQVEGFDLLVAAKDSIEVVIPVHKKLGAKCRRWLSAVVFPALTKYIQSMHNASTRMWHVLSCCDSVNSCVNTMGAFLLLSLHPIAMLGPAHAASDTVALNKTVIRAALVRCQLASAAALPPKAHQSELSSFFNMPDT